MLIVNMVRFRPYSSAQLKTELRDYCFLEILNCCECLNMMVWYKVFKTHPAMGETASFDV